MLPRVGYAIEPAPGRAEGDPLSEDLRFNVLNHELVPHHEVLSPEDAAVVFERYQIVKEQLPKLKSSDPAARVVGAKAGQVVKITRNSPTAGRAVAYRLVVEAI